MRLACVTIPQRGATDLLLSSFADRLTQSGVSLAGVVQTNTECADGYACDMDLRVLPTGEIIRISQSLGANARGCRLDPSELERAVGLVSHSLEASPALLIINKFGKHEAEGRGFRPVIGEALDRDIPVLVGVNRLNLDRFREFSGGMSELLDGNIETLQSWLGMTSAPLKQARMV